MNIKNQNLLDDILAILIFFILGFSIFSIGSCHRKDALRKEAVDAGVGKFVIDKYGKTEFKYIKNEMLK